MKTYTHTHENKKALNAHVEKILDRGGSVTIKGNTVEYFFFSDADAEIPADTQKEVDAGRVTYRGRGADKRGTRIKVHGKEYIISHEKFLELGGIKKIRFDAPHRKER